MQLTIILLPLAYNACPFFRLLIIDCLKHLSRSILILYLLLIYVVCVVTSIIHFLKQSFADTFLTLLSRSLYRVINEFMLGLL